jgi:hypothetical protein
VSVDLTWAERDLRALDRLSGEVLLCSLFEGERPPRGVAGLIDFRFGARFSRLCLTGFLTGRADELLLVPGRPKLPFDKIVVAGLGPEESFDDAAFEHCMARVLRALSDLQVRRATLELPGRQCNAVDPTRAMTVLTSLLSPRGDQQPAFDAEALTVVDDPAAHRAFGEVLRAWRVRMRR